MPPEKPTKAASEADLKAAYDRGYADAMAQPLSPDDPALKPLLDQAYQNGYRDGAEAARPPVPPFEQAKQYVRTLTKVDGSRIGQALDEWQADTGVKLNSSDINLLKTLHQRIRDRAHARAVADREMRPAYSTVREPADPIETEYQAVN